MKQHTQSELDAIRTACAEAMGWTKEPSQNEMSPMEWWWKSPAGVVANPTKPETHLPNFPIDANAALTLANALAEKGWTCGLDNTMNGNWYCEFRTVRNRYTLEHTATAPTFALALCEAFLKVIRSEKGAQ